jgi:hypothetical protein
MDLPPDKEDALLAMSINVNHAIQTKITAKNASFQEPYWTKIVFLLAHLSYSTEPKMEYLARNAQLDATLAHMTDVFHAYPDSFLTMANAQTLAQLDKLKSTENARTAQPKIARFATIPKLTA